MACHLKTISLAFNVLAIALLALGISVKFYIFNQSVWEITQTIQTAGFCHESNHPETDTGDKCVFPFVSSGEIFYDCPVYSTYLWCATSCQTNGYYLKTAKCRTTRASTLEGLEELQMMGFESVDLSRTIQATLLLAVILLAAVAIMNAIEFFVTVCAGNEIMEVIIVIMFLLSTLLILIALAITGSKITSIDNIGWALWIVLGSALLSGAGATCYILGYHGDRVARRLYPFKVTESIDESTIQIPYFKPVHHSNRSLWPKHWTRVAPQIPALSADTNRAIEWKFQGGLPYPYTNT